MRPSQQHPQSQAPLDSNTHSHQRSISRSYMSNEGEGVPMMPGGAQSSLVSTAIVAADAAGMMGAGARGVGDTGSGGVGGGGGSSGGKTIEASAEGMAVEEDNDG